MNENPYTHRPPKNAVHGPWPRPSSMSPYERSRQKYTIIDRIEAGECDCHVCKYHGKPRQLPPDYWWVRQPTPKQKKDHATRYPITYLEKWPLWIFGRFDGP